MFAGLFKLVTKEFTMADPALDFAPLVYLYPNEKYHPSSVEWYMERTELNRRDQTVPLGKYPLSPVDAQMLSRYWNSEWAVSDKCFLQPLDDGTHDPAVTKQGQSLDDHPAVYCLKILSPLGDTVTDVTDYEYWFFYPYNGQIGPSSTLSEHWGDWERITVRTKNNNVEAVYFAAHSGGKWVTTQDDDLTFWVDGGTETQHPVVYSASNSHASYPTTGTQVRDRLPDDKTDKGSPWQTWKKVVNIPPRETLAGDDYDPALGWLRFEGRWGSTDNVAVTSPSGPAYHRQYVRENPVATYFLDGGGFYVYCSLAITDGNERNSSSDFSLKGSGVADKPNLRWSLSNVPAIYLEGVTWSIDNDRNNAVDQNVFKGVKVGSVTTGDTGTQNAYIADLTYTDPENDDMFTKNDFFKKIGVNEVWVIATPTDAQITIQKS